MKPNELAETAIRESPNWAFGLTEPGAGSASRGSKTVARKVDGGWKINGAKIFITNGASNMNAGVTAQAVTGSKGEGKPEAVQLRNGGQSDGHGCVNPWWIWADGGI
jgi:hypothetical protein